MNRNHERSFLRSLALSTAALGSVIFVSLIHASAQSFDSGEMRAHGGPCAADRQKLCAGVEPGQGRIIRCMKEKSAELSAECKAHLEARKESRKEHRKGQQSN